MKAEIKEYFSPEIKDLSNFNPEIPNNFCFFLQLLIGPKNEKGAESFDIEVCTPFWFQTNFKYEIVPGRHYLFVKEYNFECILNYIKNFVESCEGSNWHEVAEKISQIGYWEFEDYKEN